MTDALHPPRVEPILLSARSRELAIAWLAAADRGDADALIACSHPQIAVHPTVLARGQRVYRGHDGQRAWLAHTAHAYARHTVDVEQVRLSPDGRLLIFGRLLVDEQAVGPFSMLMTVTDGAVIETHAYLSDEAMLQTLGHLD